MNPISVRGATRKFGQFVAVDSVDLDVARGEVVGLVGANGAGKTTLMRMILGLLPPTNGRIQLFGEAQTRQQRRRVGYVPQNLGLYRDLTASENLEFRADSYGTALPAPAGLPPNVLVADLPLGVQRRTAFTAAIQHDPELLVLDEPTSGVSPLARSTLWDLIRTQAESGAAVLVSTHYMDEAEQADRVVMMTRGRVAASGSVDEITGGRTAIEVRAADWAAAFARLDRNDRMITLDGTAIRILGVSADEVGNDLATVGIDATVRLVAATLDETMVLLEQ